MTRFTDSDPEDREPPSRRARFLFLAFLFAVSGLIYAEMIMRYSN
ncbi:MAG: hypothetical protein AAGF53_17990 [Pseudomonadota bacterium]